MNTTISHVEGTLSLLPTAPERTATIHTTTFSSESFEFLTGLEECVPDARTFRIAEAALCAAFLPVHLFIVIAMAFNRGLIKRNVTNVYAGNVIGTSVLANIVRIYITLSIYSGHESKSDLYHKWWKFARIYGFSVSLTVSGSIGLVINAIRVSSLRIHKSVAGVDVREAESCEIKKKAQPWYKKLADWQSQNSRLNAAISIAFVWIFPIILTLISTYSNTCEHDCVCSYSLVPKNHTVVNCHATTGCSNFWSPSGKVTVITGFALWVLYVVVLLLLLLKAYADMVKMINIRTTRAMEEMQRKDTSDLATNAEIDDVGEQTQINNSSNRDGSKLFLTLRRPSGVPGGLLVDSIKRNLSLLFFMYAAYIVGTTPLTVSSFLHVLDKDTNFLITRDVELIPLFFLPVLAEGMCTIMIVLKLSTVNAAVRSTVSRMC